LQQAQTRTGTLKRLSRLSRSVSVSAGGAPPSAPESPAAHCSMEAREAPAWGAG
jgi:hypothetical protein